MTFIQALILAVLQGVSELFPVSSLGQTILIPALLGWDLEQSEFLAFVVLLHLATAIALLIYFWKDWKVVFAAFLGSAKRGKLVYDGASKFAWLLVAGTVVVGLAGALLEKKLRPFFENPKYFWLVAVILIANGGVMILGDVLKSRSTGAAGAAGAADDDGPAGDQGADPNGAPAAASGSTALPVAENQTASSAVLQSVSPRKGELRSAEDLTFVEATLVGAAQALALLPGISRSGVTIVGGLLAGLTYEEASRFSFMLATPVIGLAALKEVPVLLHHENHHILKMAIPSAVLAGLTAYFSVKFLMKYFQHNRLSPFGYYCIVFGVFALVMLKMHG